LLLLLLAPAVLAHGLVVSQVGAAVVAVALLLPLLLLLLLLLLLVVVVVAAATALLALLLRAVWWESPPTSCQLHITLLGTSSSAWTAARSTVSRIGRSSNVPRRSRPSRVANSARLGCTPAARRREVGDTCSMYSWAGQAWAHTCNTMSVFLESKLMCARTVGSAS
jgi:hypothetical protein